MKKLLSLMAAFTMIAMMVGCGDDDDVAPDNQVTITGIPATAEIDNLGTLGPVTANLAADDGLATLVVTKNDAAFDQVTFDGELTATYEFSYTAEAEDEDSNVVFVFTATDTDGDTESVTHVLSVGAAPTLTRTFTVTRVDEERGPDEDNTVTYEQNEVTGIINEDFTFTNDIIWLLNGRVIVDAGVTLTIEPGTIIKGGTGQGALSSVLLIASGAGLDAQGTAADPIVFTSVRDNINLAGESYFDGTAIQTGSDGFTSYGLDFVDDIGQWGGVIILGDATISADASTTTIEGIPSSVAQAVYGGSNDTHGENIVLEYASIRFTGTQLGPGNELQGLTLGGVGSNATLNHIESISSADDGIEIFGGTVNLTNFIVWGQEDDGYDTDQAWSGTIDNFIYLGTHPTADHAFELDGPEGTSKGIGSFVNGTVWGANSSGMADLRDDSEHSLTNIFFFNFAGSADIELDAGDDDLDEANSDNYLVDETITLESLQFYNNGVATLAGIMDDKLAATATQSDTKFTAPAANNSIIMSLGGATVGATIGTDFDWSLTSQQFAGWADVVTAGL